MSNAFTGLKRATRFATPTIAAFMALTIVGTTFSTDANAGRRDRLFLGGLAAGIVGTAIIANEVRRNREERYDRSSRWERHVARCYRAYRSYDEESDTYIGYDGIERRCRK